MRFLGSFITIAAFSLATTGSAWADAGAGKAIFEGAGKCGPCHNITDKKKVGPGLAGVSKRTTDEWMSKWLKDTQGTWDANDAYTAKLKSEMKKEGKPKPAHQSKALSDQEIKDLVDYLKTL
ncbi:MAG: cytochrome c [Nitrospinae bacterium]|nr:cytochrome c [Nitrospinota bacterium]